jgi:hypothetical protein
MPGQQAAHSLAVIAAPPPDCHASREASPQGVPFLGALQGVAVAIFHKGDTKQHHQMLSTK